MWPMELFLFSLSKQSVCLVSFLRWRECERRLSVSFFFFLFGSARYDDVRVTPSLPRALVMSLILGGYWHLLLLWGG